MLWKGLKIVAALALVLILIVVGSVFFSLWRHEVFVDPTFDTVAPLVPAKDSRPFVLIFSKTNGFRHVDSIPVANAMFVALAEEAGWQTFFSENAAVHNVDDLQKFDLVVWNNVSGDVLTSDQRVAFQNYIQGGGRLLAVHATGGDPSYDWEWQPQELIRAQFVGHPLLHQFQDAILDVEDRDHMATRHLPARWSFHDEWYSFVESPRARVNVLMSLDEESYNPSNFISDRELAMGDDHPIMWWHDLGKGTVFYSAIGHLPETYEDPNYRQVLQESAKWLLAR